MTPKQVRQYWQEYELRVQALEDQGLTRSDAQGAVDAQDMGKQPINRGEQGALDLD